MPLDPEAQAYLDRVAALGLPPVQTVSPQENRRARARLMELRRELSGPDALEPVASIEDQRIPVQGGTVAARIYSLEGSGPFPVLVYFFGGGLPPALIVSAEYDPLAAEEAAYAERLRKAGVPVTHTCYPGMIHGFYSMPSIFTQARRAVEHVTAALRAALEPA